MPDVGDPTYDRDSASFLMVPYSNRIENGRFTFLKKEYQLDNVEQQAIHGDVRRRPWNTEESSTDRGRIWLRIPPLPAPQLALAVYRTRRTPDTRSHVQLNIDLV